MAKVYSLEEAQAQQLFEDASIAFGVFDGFHVGHQFLVGEMCRVAQEAQAPRVILTFDKDPDEIFRPDHAFKIMSNSQRYQALAGSGVDAVVLLPFTRSFASLDPMAFLERVFTGFPPYSLHVGNDFHFGYKGAGSITDLVFWSERTGTQVFCYQLQQCGGQPVTATRIRSLLGEGKLEEAQELMGRPYILEGCVEHGRAEGRDMGFRTANLGFPPACQVLADGVYAGYALVGDCRYKAAISMGVAPSFESAQAQCEVHLLDFEGDLYDSALQVEFVTRLRPMIKFDDINKLIATVMADIQWCRDNL